MATPPNLVLAAGQQPAELLISYSIGASAASGTIVSGSITAFGPLVPSTTTIVVPASEVWHLIDLYVIGGPAGPDAQVLIFINGYAQNIAPALTSINLNLLTRFRLPASVPIWPTFTIATSISLLAANGATAVTQTARLQVVKAPATGG